MRNMLQTSFEIDDFEPDAGEMVEAIRSELKETLQNYSNALNPNIRIWELPRGQRKIYTRDEAAAIVEMFEKVLEEKGMVVPSPEDAEKDPDNDAPLYGSVYFDLLDEVETRLINILGKHNQDVEIIEGDFSGKI